jgi:hypothetical protein
MSFDWTNIAANKISDMKRVCGEYGIDVPVPRGKPDYIQALTAYRNANRTSGSGVPPSKPGTPGARWSPASGRTSPNLAQRKEHLATRLANQLQNPWFYLAIIVFIISLIVLLYSPHANK